MTAAHLVRPAGKRPKAAARVERPEVVYPPDYFTQPVRAWRQLQFKSALVVDHCGRMKLLADAERERQRSTGVGWGKGTIQLAGTPDFGGKRGHAR